MKFLVLLFLLFSAFAVSAQGIVFDAPVRLGPNVNSEAEEMNPWLSADGQTLYFSRAFDANNTGGRYAGLDIWISYRSLGGAWQQATNKTTNWNNKESNVVIGMGSDNNSVYLLNSYRNKDGIAFSRKVNGEWISPEVVTIPGLHKSEFVGYFVNPSFTVIIISMNRKDSYGEEDLYVSVKDSTGVWSDPVNLGPTVNTEGFEIAPFLSADGKHLYFSSNGHSGYGNADIFVADRQYEDWTVWTTPRNLGNKINTDKFESYFSIFGDSVCYFTSNRESKYSDIYRARAFMSRDAADSINQIIQQTQKLLADLKSGENATGLESIDFLAFDKTSSDLSDAVKEKVRSVINKHDPAKVKIVEIGRYEEKTVSNTLSLERQRAVISYVVGLGVPKRKIISKQLPSESFIPAKANGIEIRVYLYK
jgi:hypothetical protein